MTGDPIERTGLELFGEGWRTLLPRALGLDPTTLARQRERARLPGPVAATLTAWGHLADRYGLLPPRSPLEPFRSRHASIGDASQPAIDPDRMLDITGALLFGSRHRRRLAASLGLDPASLWRQSTNGPTGPVVCALRAWCAIHALSGRTPPATPWAEPPPRKPQASGSRYADLLLGSEE